MKRRQLIKYGAASAITVATSSLLIKPSEAFFFSFLLRSLTSRFIFNSILRGVTGNLIGSLSSRSHEELLAIQIADREFIRQQFTSERTSYAQARSSIFWGQQRTRDDEYIADLGFGFVELANGSANSTMLGSPVVTGLHAAIEYLKDQGLTSQEIGHSVLPTRTQLNDLYSWNGRANREATFSSYRTVLGEVFFRYDLVQPGPGGHGLIQTIVDAAGFPRRTIDIKVDFS